MPGTEGRNQYIFSIILKSGTVIEKIMAVQSP